MIDFLLRLFGPHIERIEPGVDPMEQPIKPRRKIPWLLIISGLALAGILGARAISARAAQPSPEENQPTATAAIGTPTPTSTQTQQGTDQAQTITPGLVNSLPPIECVQSTPDIQVIKVEVTRQVLLPTAACPVIQVEVTREVPPIVVTSVVTQIVTQMVTVTTPLPTSTPWIIVVEVTRIVEVTPTPTETPTETPPPPTPTLAETGETPTVTPLPPTPSATALLEGTGIPMATPTATPTATP